MFTATTTRRTATSGAKPKLSLSISAASPVPTLTIPTARHQPQTAYLAPPTAISSTTMPSPSPLTPTSRNTRANQRGLSVYQTPSYAGYTVDPTQKSILRREVRESRSTTSSTSSSRSSSASSTSSSSSRGSAGGRRVGWAEEDNVVYCITPVVYAEGEGYVKMTRERRWERAALAARYAAEDE